MLSISEKNGIDLLEEKDINILSVGISTAGAAEIEMAKKNPKSHIIATTIDEDGMKNTQKIIKDFKLEERIELKIEDITKKLDYKDESFDYVYARLVLHYLDNQINRILKKNGKLFVVVRSVNAWEAKLEGPSYDEETGLTKHPDLRTYGTDNVKYCYRRLHSEGSIREFLEKAGFLVKHIKTYEECLSVDYDRKNMNEKVSELIEVLATK